MPTLEFPPAYIEQAANATVTTFTRRVDIYEADATTIFASDVGFESGSVAVRLDGTERRTADLTLLNHDGRLTKDRLNGFWYDKVIRVVLGIQSSSGDWEVPLGTFLPDRIGDEDYSKSLKVTCRDFSKKLQNKLPFTLAWDENTPIETVIETMASGGGVPPSRTDLPITGAYLLEPRSFSAGSDRWGSMVEIASAHGFDLFFNVHGILQMEPFTDPYTSQPQYTFQVGEYTNLGKIDRSISDSLIVNHWVVTGEDLTGSPVWGQAMNTIASSPTNIDRLGYRTDIFESAWVTDFEQAEQVAQRQLLYSSLERYECRVDALIIPWLDVNITVEFVDPVANIVDPTRYLLATLDFDLNLGPVRAELRRVTNVIELDALYPDTNIYPSPELFPNAGGLNLTPPTLTYVGGNYDGGSAANVDPLGLIIPASVIDGDLGIVFLGSYDNSASQDWTGLTGWTLAGSLTDGQGSILSTIQVYWKFLTAAEASTALDITPDLAEVRTGHINVFRAPIDETDPIVDIDIRFHQDEGSPTPGPVGLSAVDRSVAQVLFFYSRPNWISAFGTPSGFMAGTQQLGAGGRIVATAYRGQLLNGPTTIQPAPWANVESTPDPDTYGVTIALRRA